MTSDFGSGSRQERDRLSGPLTDEPPGLTGGPDVLPPTSGTTGTFPPPAPTGFEATTPVPTTPSTRGPGNGSSTTGSTTDVAKDQAGQIAGTAKDAGKQVAQSAKEQVGEVTAEAGRQARQLADQVRFEVTDQAATQQQRVAGGIRSLADELHGMARGSDQDGPATDLARQAADRMQGVAQWLEDREPGSVLDEVRSFARRRPGAVPGDRGGVPACSPDGSPAG